MFVFKKDEKSFFLLFKKRRMCYTFALAIIMKKIVKFAAVFLLASLSAFAFCETSLDDVLYSITARKVTSGDFSQEKTAPNLKRPLKSSGTFIFCDTGILWKTVKPFPSTMAVTKDSLIMTAANGTKTVTDGSHQLPRLLHRFFLATGRNLKNIL